MDYTNNKKFNNLTLNKMLQKLNELYDKEDKIRIESEKLMKEYDQLKEDKELLMTLIMYSVNRKSRGN